jgi:hypothetical protein
MFDQIIDRSITHYPFPIQKLPDDLKDSYWAEMTQGLEPEAVRKFLAWRWDKSKHHELATLREKLSTYEPAGISCCYGRSYLRLDHPHMNDPASDAGCCYLGDPTSPPRSLEGNIPAAVHAVHGGRFGFPEVVEFYDLFSDLRESIDCCGHFVAPCDWVSLAVMMDGVIDAAEHGSWQSSVGVYHGRNGDMVMLDESGAVAWYCLSENTILPIANTFAGFLHCLDDYLEKGWVLDSYSGREGY